MADSNLPSQERTIGEHVYRVTMLPVGRWLELQTLVLRIAGPALAEALASAKGASIMDLQVEGLGGALHRLSQSATASEQEKLLTMLGEATTVEGKPLTWARQGMWWARRMRDLAPFVAFALEVEFADFFAGLTSAIGATSSAEQGPSEAPESPIT
jgi:hypothetical protein